MKLSVAIALVVSFGLLAGWVPHHYGFRAVPSVHDEFGNLLEADTFAHGRLTNPPHVLPQYFQTEHQLMRPTYTAKFPPGLGLAMAAGQLLGDPIYGVFGSVALAGGAVVWLIRAWLPTRWALFGGVLVIMMDVVQFWAQTFWGGGVSMLGGALLGGAVLRAVRRPLPRYAIIAAAGFSLLLISRPLEGVITAGFCAIYGLSVSIKRRRAMPDIMRFAAIFAVGLLPILAFTAYYNWRVTGDVTVFPYALYARQFQKAPLLFGQSVNTQSRIIDNHFAQWQEESEFAEYNAQCTLAGYLNALANKIGAMVYIYLQPNWCLATLLLPLPWLLRRVRYRWLLALLLGLPVVHMAITPWMRAHYLSPVLGFLMLLLMAGARQLSQRRIGLAVCFGLLGYVGYTSGLKLFYSTQSARPLGWRRQEIISQLEQLPGEQLIVVDYKPGPQDWFEWVFNSADIDAQKVIWARDQGPQTLDDLKGLYPNRRFWRLTVANHDLNFRPATSSKL